MLNRNFESMATYLTTRKANHGALLNVIKAELQNHNDVQAKAQSLADGILLMQAFSNTLRSDIIAKFENLLTDGVRRVFQKDYKITIEFQNMGNSVYADFMVTLPCGKRVNIVNGEGGGLKDFVGVLMRMLYIVLEPSKPARFICLDECFKAVDADRAPIAFRFIADLAKELDIQVLFITHSQAVKTLGDLTGIDVLEIVHNGTESVVRKLPNLN